MLSPEHTFKVSTFLSHVRDFRIHRGFPATRILNNGTLAQKQTASHSYAGNGRSKRPKVGEYYQQSSKGGKRKGAKGGKRSGSPTHAKGKSAKGKGGK